MDKKKTKNGGYVLDDSAVSSYTVKKLYEKALIKAKRIYGKKKTKTK
jgi:hypothetical protein